MPVFQKSAWGVYCIKVKNGCNFGRYAKEDKPEFQVFGSDQKIYLPKFNFYVYADALVVAETPLSHKKKLKPSAILF